jgi:hypothetical protein
LSGTPDKKVIFFKGKIMSKKRKLDSNSKRIEFHYVKGNHHRVIKVDGAWGGLTPHADIQMSVFSERIPLPDLDEFEVTEESTIGKQTKHVSRKSGIVREIEATLVMTPTVAKALANWLVNKIAQFEATQDHEEIAIDLHDGEFEEIGMNISEKE